jgi:hypothetical protein
VTALGKRQYENDYSLYSAALHTGYEKRNKLSSESGNQLLALTAVTAEWKCLSGDVASHYYD